ncbi:hypothetical protein HDE_07761 [Halotydeus destructor]|nr:hypothetical protein HDE_07761 [Halotydeus destructor]
MSLCSSFKSQHEMTLDHRTPLPDELGHLTMSDTGKIVQSSGQLAKDDRTAKIFHQIVQSVAMSPSGDRKAPSGVTLDNFDTISVRFDDHFYSLSRAKGHVTIIKRQLHNVVL